MSKITPADAAYIIEKAETIRLFAELATETGSTGHKERADKEMSLLATFVSGISVAREG